MDYDDIVYNEGYSMKDIDENWSNSDMDYETDSDSEIDDYNYNGNTNNWSNLIGDKINRQINNHNNSFLDKINRKLESFENIDRFAKVEKENDSFLDLYERIKALNSPLKKEIDFEPHHRSSFTETMTDNWYINSAKNLQMLKTTDRTPDTEISPIKEKATRVKDRSTIESVRDIINEDKERGKIRKGIVKEMIENIERQNIKENNSLKESLCQKLKDERTNTIVQDKTKEIFERHNSENVGKVIIKDMQKTKNK